MPASKKRIQRGAGSAMPAQQVPAALREWVHIWHGVQVRPQATTCVSSTSSASATPPTTTPPTPTIFHAGSRMEELSFWHQFVRLPSNALFSTSLHTIANPRRRYKDFLYVLLNMRWPMLMSVLLFLFIMTIVAFAVIVFAFCGDPDSLLKSFNLSYQTFSTIGFGIVYPATTCSNIVMVIESFASMLVTSAITGLVFAKFAKPKAKIAFSKVCVVQPYGKKYLALVVRVANATQSKDVTHDVIMESNFKLNLLRIETRTDKTKASRTNGNSNARATRPSGVPPQQQQQQPQQDQPDDGDSNSVLCSYFLKLLQNNFITFRMGIAVVHVIDEASPLFGLTEQEICGSDMILEVSMSGVDSTLQDTVSERFTYTAEDFKWGFRFAELLEFEEHNAQVVMDFAKLSEVVRTPIDDALYVHQSKEVVTTSGPPQRQRRPTKTAPMTSKPPPNGRPQEKAAMTKTRAKSCQSTDEDASTDATRGSHESSDTSPPSQSTEMEMNTPPFFGRHGTGDSLSPDDLPETMLRVDRPLIATATASMGDGDRLTHSTSGGGGGGGSGIVTSPRPKKFSLDMEPLFEPLLQTSVGTQRLSHGEHHESMATMLLRTGRLHSGSIGGGGGGGGDTSTAAAAGEDCGQSLGDCGLPEQQRQRLQDELTGDIRLDMDDSVSSLSSSEEEENDDDNPEEEDENAIEKRRRLWRTRSNIAHQSAVSIDVQDTPRFLKISPINIPKSYDFMMLYNNALYQKWPKIIVVFIVAFLVINGFFALLYTLRSQDLVVYPDIQLQSYELSFFMSVHTLATIGYGSISPDPGSIYMNLWVFVEASLGIIVTTIITGIAWSKFARPRAHIHFSSRILVTSIYGRRCLVFRAANTRHSGDVHENFFRIGVILTNRKTGLRQLYDVPLVTCEWPSIKLPATLIHIIDESSPFFKFHSLETLLESRVSVIVLLTGLDTTFSENVYARKMYFWDDFAWNMKFADFAVLTRDHVEVDFTKFDQLLDADACYVPPTAVIPEEEEGENEDDGDEDKEGPQVAYV